MIKVIIITMIIEIKINDNNNNKLIENKAMKRK